MLVPFVLASLSAPLALAQVPVKDVRDVAAQKQAAALAQATVSALNHDIGLLQRLDIPFPKPVTFTDAPAGEVMKAIRAAAKSSIEFDSRAVGESGGWEAIGVSCEPATVRQALDAVVRAISPAYQQYLVDVAAGIIVITDEAGQKTLKAQAQYPLDATVARMGGRDGDEPALERTRAELEAFMMLTRPDAWIENGGDVGRISWTGSVATVDATPGMHHDIRRRLAQLEEALPGQNLQWAISVAECAEKADAASIDAAVGTRDALDKLVKDGGARIVSAPRLLAPATEAAEIKIGGDGGEFTARIEPAGSRSGRSFVLRVRQATAGGQASEFSMRVVPGVRSAAVFDAGGKRLIVDVLGLTEAMLKMRK